jgi:4-hydroxybenzoate polyprenyltransferase/phosphoserine phosphatase
MVPETTDGVVTAGLTVPLCVDLDGTLIATDLLYESTLALVRTRPLDLALLPVWLRKGRANLKLQVMERTSLDVTTLPYRPEVLAFLKEQKQEGRRLVLATAAQERLARQVADHLGLFDEVLGSDAVRNLKGRRKLETLRQRFGATGFDYIGDSHADLPVWQSARQAHLVSRSHRLRAQAEAVCTLHRVFECPGGGIQDLLKAIRPHQWAKNLLLFVPLLTSHQLQNVGRLLDALLALVAFCLSASSVYVVNDLIDLPSDRSHHSKRSRAFAAGRLSIPTGVVLCLMLMAAGLGVAFWLPPAFGLLLVLYLFLSIAYSAYLKEKLLLDVICLAALYAHRILAGGAATSVVISPWLLAFSMFFFLSLAFAKRYMELVANRGALWKLAGRDYRPGDLELIRAMGPVCGQLSVLVLCLYISSPDVRPLYRMPEALWLLCPIFFYWISRIWFLACREHLHEDPVLFALRDRNSYLAGALVIVVLAVAT